ncbi:MAG TPA: D-2-hydroxyacid dehydrogenase [Acidimicrobiia bacterium]|nr:D-2-hydroxyacid dehydrogenase [Acidimicrobiia bacterium]
MIVVQIGFQPDPSPEHLDRMRRLSPELDVVVAHYIEDHGVRAARGQGSLDQLRRAAPQLTDEQRDAFARAEVLLALDLPFGLGQLAPALRWVQAVGAGTDHLRGAELGRGVTVTNAAGVAAVPIAEFVIARLLGIWKRFDDLADQQRRHAWEPAYGRQVAGLTLGLVGLGAIGSAVAERARALGMRVLAVRRRPGAVDSRTVDEVVGPEGLHGMLARADAVVVCAPATPETNNLFDAAAFAAMKPGAVFCNVARGSLVDEAALLDALQAGHIAAAALDVTRTEPLPADSSLWDAPNLLLSPHSAASLDRYVESVIDLFVDNLGRYLRGESLRNVVELSTGETR